MDKGLVLHDDRQGIKRIDESSPAVQTCGENWGMIGLIKGCM